MCTQRRFRSACSLTILYLPFCLLPFYLPNPLLRHCLLISVSLNWLTLSVLQTQTVFANSVNPVETAHYEPSHQDLHSLPFCFNFWLRPPFGTMVLYQIQRWKVPFQKLRLIRIFTEPLWKHAFSNILKFSPPKNENFQIKNSDIFHISAQNIDCGYSLEPPRRGGSNEYPQSMIWSRNKINNLYPCKLQFYYIKVGFKGVKFI